MTDRYKLIRFYGTGEDYRELFDLRHDPHELLSVYGDPAYADVQEKLAKELDRLRLELKVPATVPDYAMHGLPRQNRAGAHRPSAKQVEPTPK